MNLVINKSVERALLVLLLILLLSTTLLYSTSDAMASSEYHPENLIRKNPMITRDFNFLGYSQFQQRVTIAVIGDYYYPDTIKNINYNEDEIPFNGIDDDGNGYTDDYRGMDMVAMNGNLNSVVTTNHEHGILSLLDSLIDHYGVSDTFSLLPINVNEKMTSFDDIFMKKVADAVDYARVRGAKVVSMSIGFSAHYKSFFQFINSDYNESFAYVQAAFQRASDAGMILVASATNDSSRDHVIQGQYPATMAKVVSVANITGRGVVKSGYGDNIDVGYYGTNVAVWEGPEVGEVFKVGSSYATPLVALAIAGAAAQDSTLRYDQRLLRLLQQSCKQRIGHQRNIKSRCILNPNIRDNR